jgi:hypothetical protein
VERARQDADLPAEVSHFLDFIEASRRGVGF